MRVNLLAAVGLWIIGFDTVLVDAAPEDAKPIASRPDAIDVGDALREQIEADWLQRDRRFLLAGERKEPSKAESPGGSATARDAAGGCDGVKTGRWGFHTIREEQDPWWQVDLGKPCLLDRIVVYNRTENNLAARTRNLRVLVSSEPGKDDFRPVYQHDGKPFFGLRENDPLVVDLKGQKVTARIVRLAVPGRCSFALDEVEVYPADAPQKNIAAGRPADQKSVDLAAYAKKIAILSETAPAAAVELPPAEFRLAHTRQVIDRARDLAARLGPTAARARLEPLVAELALLEGRARQLETAAGASLESRRELYFRARWLARRIALCNPLLDFDKLLFTERRHPGGLFHMVHQFYGFSAKPGGGLFVLHDPFSERPRLVNLLADATVENGRLQGRTLTDGAVLSPEVSFDGNTVLFAYSECGAEGVEWSPRASFHLFRINADGTGLVQLTDGKWDDFDPCFLPGGRIAFISDRRGGYLRCGFSSPPYHSPTYTLHSMAADGSDIVCLSFHETHEWQPSVDHDGRLVYTRWDYVDRDTSAAHHLWTCYPDGRDPRSFHGNYPLRRESRPWMEMDIRAVPGAAKYVTTAAPHHGLAFGSLVLIDPRIEDDGAMSQVERLTPEAPMPESEGGTKLIRQHMIYGTPWPLSQDDYLCAYGSLTESHGIWWIDRFGNRELIYRNPAIPSMSPIPLRPRPVPPVIPEGTRQTRAAEQAPEPAPPATVAVMNVYDSDFAWPAGTKIAALRIIQLLPKSLPRVNCPRIGVADAANARQVIGSVPVEADGSAYFEAPVGKPIFFQALDDRGMAVQSMRSATYVHPGEQLVCRGCHERKHDVPSAHGLPPLALQRSASTIEPEAEGSRPFSYVRLVQPVLDRNCVACHCERRAVDLGGAVEGKFGWTRSYQNLAAKYGFYFHSTGTSITAGIHGGTRTTPGQFGARASKLLEYLDSRHYGVRLTEQERRRVVLWLDCNSDFYGAYEDTEAQARGEVVYPSLE